MMKIKTQCKLVNESGDIIEETWLGDVSFMKGPNSVNRNGFLLQAEDIEMVVSFLLGVLEKKRSSQLDGTETVNESDVQSVDTETDGA